MSENTDCIHWIIIIFPKKRLLCWGISHFVVYHHSFLFCSIPIIPFLDKPYGCDDFEGSEQKSRIIHNLVSGNSHNPHIVSYIHIYVNMCLYIYIYLVHRSAAKFQLFRKKLLFTDASGNFRSWTFTDVFLDFKIFMAI